MDVSSCSALDKRWQRCNDVADDEKIHLLEIVMNLSYPATHTQPEPWSFSSLDTEFNKKMGASLALMGLCCAIS